METFILKLAVAVIPLVILVVSVSIFSRPSSWNNRHPPTRHFRHHSNLTGDVSGR